MFRWGIERRIERIENNGGRSAIEETLLPDVLGVFFFNLPILASRVGGYIRYHREKSQLKL